MKFSFQLLLTDDTLHCGMYSEGKIAISQHLGTPGKLSVETSVHKNDLKYSRPLILLFDMILAAKNSEFGK